MSVRIISPEESARTATMQLRKAQAEIASALVGIASALDTLEMVAENFRQGWYLPKSSEQRAVTPDELRQMADGLSKQAEEAEKARDSRTKAAS